MKRNIVTILGAVFVLAFSLRAQAPANYYESAEDKSRFVLKTALSNIIDDHNALSYKALWTAFETTDADANGNIFDIYSDCNFKHGSGDQCGNYKKECDCYNREHSFPKSWFNDASPMHTDLYHLYPTDGYTNGQRSNLPYGEVGSATYTSKNGSKKGNSVTPGYGGTVFEPADEFKGDLARTYFYMATRYESRLSSWNSPMLDGSREKVYTQWSIDLLLKWHREDAVSEKEIKRNNEVYKLQDNRNPFIDFPVLAEKIWGNDNTPFDGTNGGDDSDIFTAISGENNLRYKITEGTRNVSLQGLVSGSGVGDLVIPETVENEDITYTVTTIRSGAFKDCSGFRESLTIPNSVSTIADSAFINCSELSSILANGEIPAVLGADVFYGIDNSITVNIPCGKEATYKSTTGWDYFTNFIEFIPYTFSVVSSDEDMGTVEITKDLSCADPSYKVSFKAVPKAGSEFLNWSDGNTNSTRENVVISENVVFTAYFSTNYTITFNSNGGKGTMNAQEVVSNTPQPLNANTYTKIDYVFKGWATTATGAVAYQNRASYTATADAILYAVWGDVLDICIVEFNANGGAGTMEDQEFTEGEPAKLKLNTFTKTNYTFKGWATTLSGEVSYGDGASYTAATHATLYAVWEKGETSNELLGESKFTIYPNPVSNVLTIETTEEVRTYRIYSLQGVLQSEFTSNGLSTEIPVGNLSSGAYLLQAVKVNGAVVSVCFVKK